MILFGARCHCKWYIVVALKYAKNSICYWNQAKSDSFFKIIFDIEWRCQLVSIYSVGDIWSVGGMILTVEHLSIWRKPFLSASLSTTNPTRSGLGLKPELRGETLATNRLRMVRPRFVCIEVYGYREVVNHCKWLVSSSSRNQFVGPTCISSLSLLF